MKKYLLALLLIFAFQHASAAPPLQQPKILALYFYADWCPVCKNLSPKIAEARTNGALDKKEILFVTLNLTDKNTIHQSVLLANSLGAGEYLRAQGSGTGYLALLDAKTKKEIARLEGDATVETIRTTIEKALQ